jgi:hypothetical protein
VTHQEAVDTLATERYLLGDMTDADREAFEEHYFSCAACAADVRAATAMAQGMKALDAGASTSREGIPTIAGRVAARKGSWHRSVALPWAVAASLAVIAAYQSVLVVPGLRRELTPRALVPITLRPDSRGEEPVVQATSQTGGIALAVQVNDAPERGDLAYDISGADGRKILSGHAAVPAGGAPLLLWIPSWTTLAPMRYILSVHDVATGRPLGEYRFVVSH